MQIFTRPVGIDYGKENLEEYLEELPKIVEVVKVVGKDVKVLSNPAPYGGNYDYVTFKCNEDNFLSVIKAILGMTENDVTVFHFHSNNFSGSLTSH